MVGSVICGFLAWSIVAGLIVTWPFWDDRSLNQKIAIGYLWPVLVPFVIAKGVMELFDEYNR